MNWQPDGLSAWAAATDQLLTRAAAYAEDSAVRGAIVSVLFARMSKHHKMFSGSGSTQSDKEAHPWPVNARRAIAVELIPRLAPKVYFVYSALRGPTPLLSRSDVEFAMDR